VAFHRLWKGRSLFLLGRLIFVVTWSGLRVYRTSRLLRALLGRQNVVAGKGRGDRACGGSNLNEIARFRRKVQGAFQEVLVVASVVLHCVYFDHCPLPVSRHPFPTTSTAKANSMAEFTLRSHAYHKMTSMTQLLRFHLSFFQIRHQTLSTSYKPQSSATAVRTIPIWMHLMRPSLWTEASRTHMFKSLKSMQPKKQHLS